MTRTPPPWLTRMPPNKGPGYRRGHAYALARWWATPPWLSLRQRGNMNLIYKVARERKLHVDHIVPLRSPLVCGLHVPWNLQLMSPASNGNKSNHMWPGHPYENVCWVGEFEPQQLELL